MACRVISSPSRKWSNVGIWETTHPPLPNPALTLTWWLLLGRGGVNSQLLRYWHKRSRPNRELLVVCDLWLTVLSLYRSQCKLAKEKKLNSWGTSWKLEEKFHICAHPCIILKLIPCVNFVKVTWKSREKHVDIFIYPTTHSVSICLLI